MKSTASVDSFSIGMRQTLVFEKKMEMKEEYFISPLTSSYSLLLSACRIIDLDAETVGWRG